MKTVLISQARLSSTRLPGKVLLPLGEESSLALHLKRLKKARKVDEFVLAIADENGQEKLAAIAADHGFTVCIGSCEDVLSRFHKAAMAARANVVVRVTSDCPLIDPAYIDDAVAKFHASDVDYMTNNMPHTLPEGMDCEVFRMDALSRAFFEATLPSEREHVTPYIWKNCSMKGGLLFSATALTYSEKPSPWRLTLDHAEDLDLLRRVVGAVGEDANLSTIQSFLDKHPEFAKINGHIHVNEGYVKSLAKDLGTGRLRKITQFAKSDLYRAQIHRLIPGGAHTYSKGDDQFPTRAPAAVSHGRGSQLWDLDGNQYLDCSMGLTSVSLGHAYEPVLEAVRRELNQGVNFSRPSAIEREMAETFLALVPQHQMIKFSKNGSTATTAAVKLARAFTGRQLVAFPGDHPFYSYDDWYIGSTACNRGVPDPFRNLSVTYSSLDLATLEKALESHPGQIACVISEPERPTALGEKAYLERLIAICHKHGALFIQDEMITGFKTHFPGSLVKFGITPDLVTWGKGIANGFSFCALTGRREVMELGGITHAGQDKVFLISTTHGGETHAMAAAMATIREFKSKEVLQHNHKVGREIIEGTRKVITKASLAEFVTVTDSPWLVAFNFLNRAKEADSGLRTLFMQEMIARGVLFQGSFVPCFSHSTEDVAYFVDAFAQACTVYAQGLEEGWQKFLVGPAIKPVFRKKI